jgi:hypothetical protein
MRNNPSSYHAPRLSPGAAPGRNRRNSGGFNNVPRSVMASLPPVAFFFRIITDSSRVIPFGRLLDPDGCNWSR